MSLIRHLLPYPAQCLGSDPQVGGHHMTGDPGSNIRGVFYKMQIFFFGAEAYRCMYPFLRCIQAFKKNVVDEIIERRY